MRYKHLVHFERERQKRKKYFLWMCVCVCARACVILNEVLERLTVCGSKHRRGGNSAMLLRSGTQPLPSESSGHEHTGC